MDKSSRTLPTGFWLACFALFVMGFAFTSGSRVIVNHTITKEIIVPQTLIELTDHQRINLFINEMLPSRQASCFKKVLTKEAHFNVFAKNPLSTATGVGQLLASTYRNLGLRKSNDPIAQTVASLIYINERYGTAGACGAWHHELRWNWY